MVSTARVRKGVGAQVRAWVPSVVVSCSGRGARLFLSEHTGDARPDTLVCLRVENLEAVAQEFAGEIVQQPWGPEVHLVDLDGNRLRIGDAAPDE